MYAGWRSGRATLIAGGQANRRSGRSAPSQGIEAADLGAPQALVGRQAFLQTAPRSRRNRRRFSSQYEVRQRLTLVDARQRAPSVGWLPLQPTNDRHDVVEHHDIADRLRGVRESGWPDSPLRGGRVAAQAADQHLGIHHVSEDVVERGERGIVLGLAGSGVPVAHHDGSKVRHHGIARG